MPEVVALPRRPIAPDDMPEPQRQLLVHEHDMTSTLAAHHNSVIDLKVLDMVCSPNEVVRTVVLLAGDKPVEYGWITIQLGAFPPEVQAVIQAGERPLGGIMESHGTTYLCDPHTYFSVQPDAALSALLATSATTLYGRVNRITTPDGECIADVVEILP